MQPPQGSGRSEAKHKLPAIAHVMCGWPLAMVAFGGAIGGGLGGVAYAINIALYKSSLPVAAKVALNLMTGAAAIVIWAVIAGVIHSRWK